MRLRFQAGGSRCRGAGHVTETGKEHRERLERMATGRGVVLSAHERAAITWAINELDKRATAKLFPSPCMVCRAAVASICDGCAPCDCGCDHQAGEAGK